MKQAMIFAAGLGTRLKPLTDKMPKALVCVDGEPLLKRVLLRLREAGYERIVVNVHHFATQITDYLQAHDNFGMDVKISDETCGLLDTGGGLKKAACLFDTDSPVLIHNVDILSNLDLAAISSMPLYDSDAQLVVSERKTSRYLIFDNNLILHGWTNIDTQEVRSPHADICSLPCEFMQSRYKLLAFSGIHVVSPSVFCAMEAWPEKFSIMDFYIRECANLRICGLATDGLKLLDVGKLNTLNDATTFVRELNSD